MSAKVVTIDGRIFVSLSGKTLPMPEAVMALRSLQAEAADGLREAEAAMVDAERSHGVALAGGGSPDREVLTAAKADIERARKSLTAIEGDLESIQADIVTDESARMINTAVADIEQTTGIRPDLTEVIARRVTELGLQLSVTEAEHHQAQTEAEGIQLRVTEIEQRISAITARRLDGKVTKTDGDELTALGYDVESLRGALSQANQKAASLDPTDLRAQYQRTVADWNSHIRDAKLKVLASVVTSKETELVNALSRLVDSAHSAGIQNLTDVWRPSASLEAFTSRTLLSALTRRAA